MPDCWQRFYVSVPETEALYNLMLDIRETASRVALRTKNPAWLAVADQAQVIQTRFAANLDRIAVAIAAEADTLIKAKLKAATLRPPTGNRPGLQDGIHSAHVSTGRVSFGVVEVGLIDELQKVVGDVSGVPFWKTQEFGSQHNIGRRIVGFFVGAGGQSVPNPIEGSARVHPAFQSDPAGGLGTIRRPIPAKHFMRDGTREAEVHWRALVQVAVQQASNELARITIPAVAV